MFSNAFYDNDDFFGYHRPQRYRDHDGSIGRYLRMKEQENLEADYARRRQRELQEQRLHEHRRQQAIAKRQRMLREWKKQQQLMHQQKVEEDNDENNDIDIIRGVDGNLYFINRLPSPRQEHRLPQSIPEKNRRFSREFYPAPIVEEESVTESGHGYELLESDVDADLNRMPTNADTAPNNLGKNTRNQRNKHPYRKRSKQRITVTVEDASDSDCENEFDSPWRNRRPSPGQWIEPVESYCE